MVLDACFRLGGLEGLSAISHNYCVSLSSGILRKLTPLPAALVHPKANMNSHWRFCYHHLLQVHSPQPKAVLTERGQSDVTQCLHISTSCHTHKWMWDHPESPARCQDVWDMAAPGRKCATRIHNFPAYWGLIGLGLLFDDFIMVGISLILIHISQI